MLNLSTLLTLTPKKTGREGVDLVDDDLSRLVSPGGESHSKCSRPPASTRMVGRCCGRCRRNHLQANGLHGLSDLMK